MQRYENFKDHWQGVEIAPLPAGMLTVYASNLFHHGTRNTRGAERAVLFAVFVNGGTEPQTEQASREWSNKEYLTASDLMEYSRTDRAEEEEGALLRRSCDTAPPPSF